MINIGLALSRASRLSRFLPFVIFRPDIQKSLMKELLEMYSRGLAGSLFPNQ
jgi:hypothetical protein